MRVKPPVVDVCDILEYARALLEEHGWRQGPRVPDTEDWDEVVKGGLSLHDAIGMACFRLSGETGRNRGTTGRSNKEFPTRTGSLWEATTEALMDGPLPRGQNDVEFNDAARDVADVLAVLDAAIAKECE